MVIQRFSREWASANELDILSQWREEENRNLKIYYLYIPIVLYVLSFWNIYF
jgi:hypothetical protein